MGHLGLGSFLMCVTLGLGAGDWYRDGLGLMGFAHWRGLLQSDSIVAI